MFHNSNLFGSCIILILYTQCAKIKKNNSISVFRSKFRQQYFKKKHKFPVLLFAGLSPEKSITIGNNFGLGNSAQAKLDCFRNVMAHAQKPDFVFRRNGRVHLNRRGASVQSTTGSRGVRMSGINAGYKMFRGSVKGTGYPFHSPVSPSPPRPCVTVCHHISIGLLPQSQQCAFCYCKRSSTWQSSYVPHLNQFFVYRLRLHQGSVTIQYPTYTNYTHSPGRISDVENVYSSGFCMKSL